MKKLLCVTLVLALLIGILPVGLVASAAEEIYLDKDSVEYSEVKGYFIEDPITKDEKGKTTRYSFSKNAQISYSLNVETSGNYEIFYYNSAAKANGGQQKVSVVSNGKEDKITLFLKERSGWKSLGVYALTVGGENKVVLSRGQKGGCIRSGALKFVPTDKETFVAISEPNPITLAMEKLSGIVISTGAEGYEEYYMGEVDYSNGMNGDMFLGSSLGDCRGRASRYVVSIGSMINYRPTIEKAGEYHVLYFINSHEKNLKNQPTIVAYDGGQKYFSIDCTAPRGWVYLGKFNFKEGNEGLLMTLKNDTGAFLRSSGARFVSVLDEEFDSTKYPKAAEGEGIFVEPPLPGQSSTPELMPESTTDIPLQEGADANENGEYIISTTSKGYAEIGEKGMFYSGSSLKDCEGNSSHYISSSNEHKGYAAMVYTPNIKEAGEYEVFYYVMPHSSNNRKQDVIVNFNGGSKIIKVDCQRENGWVSLGRFKFKEGNEGNVVTEHRDGKMVRSGGVKFTK